MSIFRSGPPFLSVSHFNITKYPSSLYQFEKIGRVELEKYRQQKLTELTTLETEYQNALRDIGLGHEGVAEEVRTCL